MARQWLMAALAENILAKEKRIMDIMSEIKMASCGGADNMTKALRPGDTHSQVALARRSSIEGLYARVRAILEESRSDVVRSVNSAMVRAYWLIGRR